MKVDNAVMFGVFTAIESAQFFSAFLPSIFTIKKFGSEWQSVESLREGEAVASAFAVGLGIVVSKLTDSSMPMIFSVVVSILMVGVYEYAIMRSKGEEYAGYTG